MVRLLWALMALQGGITAIASAQQWNDPRTLDLARAATERRARQAADSGLLDYQAMAHGYVTFLMQLGEGFREPPKVVKADELALQVYWRAPNLSKQLIVGRRDTTVLPTDIQYHRDHLGIVQNNFPAIIRIGEGDEVRDVPHPLSPDGLQQYDFALTDSLRISAPGQVVNVFEVKVRPKDDRRARVLGALYLDRDNAQVVRMALSFTRAAFLDDQLEDLFVVLENGLVGARFWLPRRQEIEIRRTATWLDYPVRGIIRGRWEIGDFRLNTGIPVQQFTGPEIVQAPRALLRSYGWSTARILDSLPPDVRAVTAEEIRRVQAEAQMLVREQALRRTRSSALAARGISDFVLFNRVEGVSLGAGASAQLGAGRSLSARGRYGFDDRRAKGRADMAWQNARGDLARIYVAHEYVDVSNVPERSLLVNSLAAQEFGNDYTDLFRVTAVGAEYTKRTGTTTWTFDVAREEHRPLTIHASPATNAFSWPLPADSISGLRARVVLDQPPTLWSAGLEVRSHVELRGLNVRSTCIPACAPTTVLRAAVDLEVERPFGDMRVVSRTIAAVVRGWNSVPAQELVYVGGPVTAPGYGFHEIVGSLAASQRAELRFPIPFPGFSLGRFGRSPAQITAAPFVGLVGMNSLNLAHITTSDVLSPGSRDRLTAPQHSLRPTIGMGFLTFFDLVRFDVARGLNDGRWMFYVDVNRTYWSVL